MPGDSRNSSLVHMRASAPHVSWHAAYMVEATQKLLEDQSRERKAKKRGWWPLFHDET